jgi:hypothetical protein
MWKLRARENRCHFPSTGEQPKVSARDMLGITLDVQDGIFVSNYVVEGMVGTSNN